VIELIRGSHDRDAARQGLMDSFGLTQVQAQAILELRLQQLTALEADTIRREHADKVERIRELSELLGDEGAVMALIKEELSRSPSATAPSAGPRSPTPRARSTSRT
jgi:DNA gyrase subunit A